MMSEEQVLKLLRDSGALLEGHFLLSSGKHSSRYVQCALVCRQPEACALLCRDLAEQWKDEDITLVVAPAIGGIVLGYELARAVGVPGIFMERPDGEEFVLRRGFTVEPSDRVLVAEDVITTGGSVREVVSEIRERGAQVIGTACIVDRSGGRADVGAPLKSCIQLDIPVYEQEDCPLCDEGTPAIKPGSRNI